MLDNDEDSYSDNPGVYSIGEWNVIIEIASLNIIAKIMFSKKEKKIRQVR